MPRPVILDEFEVDSETGQLAGNIEVIDGRLGASLEARPPSDDPTRRRPWPLLLYHVWADPWALRPVNDEHLELVQKYTGFLEATWEDHHALGTQFSPGAEVALTPEQVERLRSLGYIG